MDLAMSTGVGWEVVAGAAAGPAVIVGIAVITLAFKIGGWRSETNTRLDGLEKTVVRIEDDVKNILRQMPSTATVSQSPLRLTEFGEQLAEFMGAFAWAENIAPEVNLLDAVEPYEIDEIADDYSRNGLDKETDDLVARCAYQFGTDQANVRSALRVVLRDELIKRVEQTVEKGDHDE